MNQIDLTRFTSRIPPFVAFLKLGVPQNHIEILGLSWVFYNSSSHWGANPSGRHHALLAGPIACVGAAGLRDPGGGGGTAAGKGAKLPGWVGKSWENP